mmetsp:Transcript_53570/g.127611  ORF Transcript_53570/g.127611 Transcript_53570/m.127611 type:complete len:343 (-) Transcript_53570:329-1357(-)
MIMSEVLNVRDPDKVTQAYFRIIRDANETFRAFHRQDEEKPWVPFAPAVHWPMRDVTIGLYAAHCGPEDETTSRGISSADFDFLRSRGAAAIGKSFGAAGGSGLVAEFRWTKSPGGADPEVQASGGGAALNGALWMASNSSGGGVASVTIAPGTYTAGGAMVSSGTKKVVLRGSVVPSDFSEAWGESGTQFVKTDRYVETFTEFEAAHMWNGTGWLPRVLHYNVTIQEEDTPVGGRYAIYIDGVPRQTLTVYRPSSKRLTTVHIFTLHHVSFNGSILPPPEGRNMTTYPAMPDGGGLAHAFQLLTGADTGTVPAGQYGVSSYCQGLHAQQSLSLASSHCSSA